jgi:uncharacterized membrane protein
MKLRLFNAILMLTLWTLICMAQPNSSQDQSKEVTKWGNAVEGVQLSVNSTNNIVVVDSTTTLFARIRNLSTNTITLTVSDLRVNDFTVYLTDSSKNIYKIAEPSGAVFAVFPPINITPGESHILTISLTVDKNIEPGDYTLKATRHFSINNSFF